MKKYRRIDLNKYIIREDSPCYRCIKDCGECVLGDGRQMSIKNSENIENDEKG